MRHLEVLVITKNTTTPKILNWKVSTTNNIETAIEKLQLQPYKVVAISNTIAERDRIKLNLIISKLFVAISIVEFSNVATLSKTVKTAHWSNNKVKIDRNYFDNSLEIKLANSIHFN